MGATGDAYFNDNHNPFFSSRASSRLRVFGAVRITSKAR